MTLNTAPLLCIWVANMKKLTGHHLLHCIFIFVHNNMASKKNRERSSQGCTSAHTWAEKVKSKAKVWLTMHTHKEKNSFEWPTLAVLRVLPKCIPQSLAVGFSRHGQEEEGWDRGRESECGWEWAGLGVLKVLIRCVFWANNRIHRKGKWATLQFSRSADSTEIKVQQYTVCTRW